MRITRIEVDGFGCLREFCTDIAPGLHIFDGPNESGKSTLQRAIFALLYGFYEGDRAKAAENAARERFAPWSGSPYSGHLVYDLAAGGRYRVERDFRTSDVPTAVWDMRAGREVTDEFGRGRHGNVPFARRHLGMNRRVFDACAFVSQGELFEIAKESRAPPQEIGDTIISIADTARPDVSAQAANSRLDGVLRERVGTSRSRTTSLPVAQRRLDQARTELHEIERVRSELADAARQLESVLERCDELRESIKRTSYHLLRAEQVDLANRLEELTALYGEDGHLGQEISEHSAFAHWPIAERDAVREQHTTLQDLRQTLEQDSRPAEDARYRLAELAEGREKLARKQRELAHLQDFPVDRKSRIEELMSNWRTARGIAQEAEKRLGETPISQAIIEEHHELEAQVGELSSEQIEFLTQRLLAPPPNWLLRVLGAVWRGIARGLRWLWRQVVALVRRVFRRRADRPEEVPGQEEAQVRPPRDSSPVDSLALVEVREVLRKHARYAELSPAVEKFQTAKGDADEATQSLETVERDIRSELEGLVDMSEDLEEAWSAYSERAHGRQELESLRHDIGSMDREAAPLHDLVSRFERTQRRLATLESSLEAQLPEWTRANGSLEELLHFYEEGCARRIRHDEAVAKLRGSADKRSLILRGRSPKEVEIALSRTEIELQRLLENAPWLEGAETDATRDELEQERKEVHGDLGKRERKVEELRTRIDTKLEDLRSRAEVEEDIQRYGREVATLNRFGEELSIAIELIDQAMTEAHRDFAPSVGRFLSQGLARITGDRYTKVLLDPSTLRLTAEVPETRRLEDVELLSRGTRAAAYLLLRVGLAQHMSSMAEPVPLILDDPLVDLDDVRLENFLELLLELTGEVQILLFSKDQRTRAWFAGRCAQDPLHKLTYLTPPPAGT